MVFTDILKEIFWSLSGNRIRSGLTILGIVIGIASVITLVSIGQGAQKSIESNIQSIGSNLIIISPGAQRSGGVSQGQGSAQSLTKDDADAITQEVIGVSGVAPEVSRRYQVTARGTNTNTQVIGTTAVYASVRNVKMNIGSFIGAQQIRSSAKVAIVGSSVRDELFGENTNPVGQTVRIRNSDFEVVGVTQAKGGSGFSNPDDMIYIPITSAQHFLSGDEYLSSISVAAESQDTMASVQSQITGLLLRRHGISDPTQADFNILNQTDIIATASNITGTFTVLLSSIAGISLLVGGIGIMNMMLTTVTERTREIGLRKAVGIRRRYIYLQFLFEAVALTFLGGILGIFWGWVASISIASLTSLATEISVSSIFLAFGVSAVVGIVFGFYPARKAARLSPIDALRYE